MCYPIGILRAAVIEEGAASLIEGSLEPRDGVVAAVVYERNPSRIERNGEGGLDTTVSTPSGRFMVRVHSMTGLVSMVWPYDAPPFVRHGSNGRLAPVRAKAYDLAKKALEKLSVEALLTLTPARQ